ncbi:MAG: type II secretion system protein [Phycisphaerales bacterium]
MQRLLNARRGFTLIELLVVIAIVALLIGMLMPALSGARDSARSVKCLASMRSLGVAMSLYSEDNEGLMPRSKHSVGFSGLLPWGPQMFEYLTDRPFEGTSEIWQDESWWNATNDFYRCAHDRRESPVEIAGLPFSTVAVSYGFNVYYELRREEIDPEKYSGNRFEPYRKRSSIPRPSGTILLGEMSEESSADHIMSHFWRTRGVEAGFEVATERHGDGAGYLLLDGHAETRSFGEVYDAENSRDAWYPAMVQ